MNTKHEKFCPRNREDVAEYFGRLAPVYGGGEYYGARRAAVAAAISSELRRARRILDLGCGSGAYIAEFRADVRAAPSMVGVDLSLEMLIEARRRVPDVALARCDASMLPFREAIFDLVFCSHVLLFVHDLDGCVAGIARCLAPGGLLITTFGTSGMRSELQKRIEPSRWKQFEAAVFGEMGAEPTAHDEKRYRAAYERAALAAETRAVSFTVSWDTVAEWIRLRWLSVSAKAERSLAEEIIGEAQAAGGEPLTLHEPLLLGRKK